MAKLENPSTFWNGGGTVAGDVTIEGDFTVTGTADIGTITINDINLGTNETADFGDNQDIQLSYDGSNFIVQDNQGNTLQTWSPSDGDITFNQIAGNPTFVTHTHGEQGLSQIVTGGIADAAVTSAKVGAGEIGDAHFGQNVPSRVNFANLTAGEAISGSHLVAINSNGEVVRALAKVNDQTPARAVSNTAVSQGNTVTDLRALTGNVSTPAVQSGAKGDTAYVSASTAGEIVPTPPSSSGDVQQVVGEYVANDRVVFAPEKTGVDVQ